MMALRNLLASPPRWSRYVRQKRAIDVTSSSSRPDTEATTRKQMRSIRREENPYAAGKVTKKCRPNSKSVDHSTLVGSRETTREALRWEQIRW